MLRRDRNENGLFRLIFSGMAAWRNKGERRELKICWLVNPSGGLAANIYSYLEEFLVRRIQYKRS